ARLAEIAQSKDGWDRASWPEIARLGWTGASIPEAQGGAGLSFVEEAIVFEELGRALYAGPYFSTVALALPALACAPDLLARVASGALTATLASPAADASRPGWMDVVTAIAGSSAVRQISFPMPAWSKRLWCSHASPA